MWDFGQLRRAAYFCVFERLERRLGELTPPILILHFLEARQFAPCGIEEREAVVWEGLLHIEGMPDGAARCLSESGATYLLTILSRVAVLAALPADDP